MSVNMYTSEDRRTVYVPYKQDWDKKHELAAEWYSIEQTNSYKDSLEMWEEY